MKKGNYIAILTLSVFGAVQGMAAGPDENGIYASGGKLYTSAAMTEEVNCGTLARLKAGTVNYWYEGCEACAQGEYCRVSTYTTSGECNQTNAAYYRGVKGECTPISPSDVKQTAEIAGLGTVTYSSGSMNWWSAKTWCEALGLHLIDSTTMTTYFDALSAASGKSYGWTMTTWGSAHGDFTCGAYYANFVNGSMYRGTRDGSFQSAFCL